MEGVLQVRFVFGLSRCDASCVGGGKKQGLYEVKVLLLCHAVHQNRTHHAAPTDQTHQLAHYVAFEYRINIESLNCKGCHDGVAHFLGAHLLRAH